MKGRRDNLIQVRVTLTSGHLSWKGQTGITKKRCTPEFAFNNGDMSSKRRVLKYRYFLSWNIPWLQLITESQTSVTALFFYHGVKKEIELWKKAEQTPPLSEDEKQKILQKCKISISKYAKAILLCKSFMRSSSLEILIVGDQETYQVQEVEKETFALIRLKGILFVFTGFKGKGHK